MRRIASLWLPRLAEATAVAAPVHAASGTPAPGGVEHSKSASSESNSIRVGIDKIDDDRRNSVMKSIRTINIEELKKLAETAKDLKGYILEVTGYADATGGAQMNTKLSENRAKAVVTYLTQQGNVPIRHIVAPGAMGEYGAVAPNETKAGRAENRRVEVKVLVNKGIAGS